MIQRSFNLIVGSPRARTLLISLIAAIAATGAGRPADMGGSQRDTGIAHVTLTGIMQSAGSFSKQVTIHVPPGLSVLTVNVSIPISIEEGAWRQTISHCTISLSATPSRQIDEVDSMGNHYRVLVFNKPESQDIQITQTIDEFAAEATLDAPLPTAAYPLTYVSNSATNYLRPSKSAQSDDAAIMDLAQQLTRRSRSEADAVSRISRWTFGNLSYATGSYIDVIDACTALSTRCAQCRGYANLFIALARAAGIPARLVTGYTLRGSLHIPISSDESEHLSMDVPSAAHAWVEIWYPEVGWIPYDPQTSAGFVDSHHIQFSIGASTDDERPFIQWSADSRTFSQVRFQEDGINARLSDNISLQYVGQSGIEGTSHILLERQALAE